MNMSILGDGKSIVDLLTRGWTWVQERRDPVRAQAQRMIDAFEAHGIARQQIARVLPPELAVPPAALSTPDKLKEKVTPALLDWAADYLALDRRWLDGVEARPHRHVDGYKNEGNYSEWLRQRQAVAPDVGRVLFVWTAEDPISGGTSDGPVCLVYSEDSAWLDGGSLSRYWLLSDQWPIDHGSCVVSMLKVVGIARSLGILVVGRLIPAPFLRRLEAGRIFAPQAQSRGGNLWNPEDMKSSNAVASPVKPA
ncbi:MAG: hypothetical protein ACKVOX_17285 [Rhizobacter sp.]